jgi:D-proline reductase (dithiol) PrdB
MSMILRLKNRLIAKAVNLLPVIARKVIAGYTPRETQGEIPWAPLKKPLADCRVAVVTTAGIHHHHQPPFNMQALEGDPSWRR